VSTFYFQIGITNAALLLQLAAAVIACRRFRHPASFLQLTGMILLVLVNLGTLLPVWDTDKRHVIQPAWLWRAGQISSGVAVLIFAVGYAWYWMTQKNRPEIST
jgi:hypothetical protein